MSAVSFGRYFAEAVMPIKHHKPEQIIAKLRQIEVFTAQGKTLTAAYKDAGVFRAKLLPMEERIRRPDDRPGQEVDRA